MRVLIILPTYNEKENIEPLIRDLLAIDPEFRVLVVDDQSPDGTGEIAQRLGKELDGRVEVMLREPPRGRGLAGRDGFDYARKMEDIDYVVEMDADYSHHPNDLPALLKAAPDYDLVIGSRYVKGGRVEGWGLHRKINSFGANNLARLLLGLKSADATSGYRVFRREILNDIKWDLIITDGPAIVEEVLFYLQKSGRTMKEVPIVFKDREVGTSKLRPKMIISWIKQLVLVRLRYKKNYPQG